MVGKDELLDLAATMFAERGLRATTVRDIADVCKRREDWVRRTVRAYNEDGPEGLVDGRQENGPDPR